MSPRANGRVAVCTPAEADARRRLARFLLTAAESTMSATDPAQAQAAAAIAVTSAVAASDAICGRALGRYSRGQDHQQAIALLRTVEPGGVALANAYSRVIASKDDAQYSPVVMGVTKAQQVLRSATALVEAAER